MQRSADGYCNLPLVGVHIFNLCIAFNIIFSLTTSNKSAVNTFAVSRHESYLRCTFRAPRSLIVRRAEGKVLATYVGQSTVRIIKSQFESYREQKCASIGSLSWSILCRKIVEV